jgi:hypothetical protein
VYAKICSLLVILIFIKFSTFTCVYLAYLVHHAYLHLTENSLWILTQIKCQRKRFVTYTFSFQPGNWYAPSPTCGTMEGRQDPVKVLSKGKAKTSCKIHFLTNKDISEQKIFKELPQRMWWCLLLCL